MVNHMSKEITLSVTVLSYNNEQYIVDCLDSIVRQGIDSYEVLVVDDCSTDGSVKVINDYIAEHPEFRLIEKETNSGGAVSSQIGIENSRGKYCSIIDCDDILAEEAYKRLISRIEKDGSDFASGMPLKLNSGYLYNFLTSEKESSVFAKDAVISDIEDKMKFSSNIFYWDTVFRTDFLKKNNIHMPSGLLIADRIFMFDAIYKADKISIDHNIVYFWRKKNNPDKKSITDLGNEYRGIADRCDSFEAQIRITLDNTSEKGDLNLGLWENSIERLYYPLSDMLRDENINRETFRKVCDRYRLLLTEYAGFFLQLLDGGRIKTPHAFFTTCLLENNIDALLSLAGKEDFTDDMMKVLSSSDRKAFRRAMSKGNNRFSIQRVGREGGRLYAYVHIPTDFKGVNVDRIIAINRFYKTDFYEMDYDNSRNRFEIGELPNSVYYFAALFTIFGQGRMAEFGKNKWPTPEIFYEEDDLIVTSAKKGGNPFMIMDKNRYTFLGDNRKPQIYVNNDDDDIKELFFYNVINNKEEQLKQKGENLYIIDLKKLPQGRNILLARHRNGTCSTVNRYQFTNSMYQMKQHDGLFISNAIVAIK